MIAFRALGFNLLITGFLFGQTDSAKVLIKTRDTSMNGFSIPVFSSSGGDAESAMEQQDVSSLLQSSPDVFMQFTGFQFGMGRYRLRGYAAENQQVMINGINMNDPETGFSAWSSWGGLNDITRYPEVRFGNSGSPYGFQGPGGYVQMDTRASALSKGSRVSYTNANRIFQHRMMLTHATGMMQNGWALAASASTRQGKEVYIPGTFFNSSSFFLAAEKRAGKKHLLGLSAFFSPLEQGRASAETLEACELAGSTYYNALWGYQNGKVRNSTVSSSKQPVMMFTHRYQPDDNSSWSNSLVYTFGKSSITGLNWNNSPNPRPDYYYYMPGYYYAKGNAAKGDQVTQQWMDDVNTRQVNWDKMIAMNQANLYTPPSQLGQAVNTDETRARYILEERIEDKRRIGLNSVYNKRAGNLFFSLGANFNIYRNRKYAQVNDLLGASYWLDYDQFAQNLGVDPMIQQNNLEHPDQKIRQGQKIGYDYSMIIRQAETWAQAEYNFKKLEIYGAVSLSTQRLWKESYVANGKFPDSSKGESEKMDFLNYGIKGGATYKVTGKQFVTVNGLSMTRAPEANKLFVSQTVRNDHVRGISSEKVISGDVSYILQYSSLKLRATYYNTQINGQTWLQRYWSDLYNTNINYVMTGVNENHQGLELGIEKIIETSHVLQGAFGYGRYVYTNRPLAQAWQDNNNAELFNGRTVYLKNYRTGASPQLVAGSGYRYNAGKRWFAAIYLNYFDAIYLEPNPDRRTVEALGNYSDKELPQVDRIIRQEQLPAYYLVNLSVGKSFRINKRYYLKINLNVNNLANRKHIITGGYEQLRWDTDNVDRFASKYFFMTGTTYLAIISLNF